MMNANYNLACHQSGKACVRSAVRRAFSVVELLVVIVIIVIVLAIATPAFRALIYSSERSLAFNSVEAAVASARDLALRSAGGDDGAVVFLHEPGRPMRIVPAVRVGSFSQQLDPGRLDAAGQVTVDVFAPVADVTPVELPLNWHVRGFAAAGSMIDLDPKGDPFAKWYNSESTGGNDVDDDAKEERNWVFPETGFYATDLQVSPAAGSSAGVRPSPGSATARQSFMIRFNARTGGLSANGSLAVVIDPRPSTLDRIGGENPDATDVRFRADRSEDLVRWARGILSSAPFNARTGQPLAPPYRINQDGGRPVYIGIDSNDTVLVKPVTRLAVYDERRMAPQIGARSLNRETGTIYQPVPADGSGSREIQFDLTLFQGGLSADQVRGNINAWIEGDTNGDNLIDDEDEPQARLYLIRPLTGELTEVIR